MSSENIITTPTNRKFRLGFLGAGEQAGESRIPAARRDRRVTIAAVADANRERAELVANEFDIPNVCESLAALLELVERNELDAVIVALPPSVHLEAVLALLDAGAHVLCEKPFGRDSREAEAMMLRANAVGRVLATGYQYPVALGNSLRLVDAGEIGTPYLVQGRWLRSTLSSDRGVPTRSAFWNDPNGRGVGADLGSHLLSVAVRLLGSQPTSVSARTWSFGGRRLHGEKFRVEDLMSLTVEWRNARAELTAAWAADVPVDELGMRCFASNGSLDLPLMAGEEDPRPFGSTVIGSDGERPGHLPIPTEDAFVVQQRNFVSVCQGGKEDLLSGPEVAVAVQRVLDAAYESASNEGVQTPVARSLS